MIPLLVPAALGLIGGYLAKEPVKYAKGGLIAPNGKPSNLTPEQWKLVRTPEFKAWFGDWENDPANASKVVDENGEPLICFHGTDKEFNIFNLSSSGTLGKGIYFTSEYKIAKKYPLEASRVINAFLNLRNPKFVESSIGYEWVKGEISIKTWDRISYKHDEIYKRLIKLKYDGVIWKYKPYLSLSNQLEIAAFYPKQIKLADGSNTTFDAENPDIRYASGGATKRIIYHFSESLDNLYSILHTNSLTSGSYGNYGRGYDNISFTWNDKLWDIEYAGDEDWRWKVRISFDYDKLNEKWKLEPFDYGIPDEKEEIYEGELMKDIIPYITEILISNEESIYETNFLKKEFPKLKIKRVRRNKFVK